MNGCVELLIQQGITYFVSVTPMEYRISKNCESIRMEDARSAAFYALGVAIKTNSTVVLMVPGEYISSTYTAVTEAWFQKARLVVVAVYQRVSEVKTAWMDRCILDQLICRSDELAQYNHLIPKMLQKKGPILINLIDNNPVHTGIDYTQVLSVLKSVADSKTEIICYNTKMNFGENDFSVHVIDKKHKYGVLSKYIGGAAVTDMGILCCTADCVLVDVNIFRTRYANKNMKIVVVDKEDELKRNHIDQWIKSNDWNYFETDIDNRQMFQDFYKSNKAAVLTIGG